MMTTTNDANNINDDDENLSNDVSLSNPSFDSGSESAEATEAEDSCNED